MRFIGSLRIACLALALFGSAPALPQVTAERVQPRIVDIAAHVSEASQRFGIPEQWIYAVMRTESAGRIGAVSSKGAQGLMQLMPATARELDVSDPLDPQDNINGGAKCLRFLLDSYNWDLELSLAAYNAGPGRVKTLIPNIPETRKYVAKVLASYQNYQMRR